MIALTLQVFLLTLASPDSIDSERSGEPPLATTEFESAGGRIHIIIPNGLGQDMLKGWIEQRSTTVIQSMDLPPLSAGERPPWTIRIEASGHVYDFRSSVRLLEADTAPETSPEFVVCKCKPEVFLDSIESRMRAEIDSQLRSSQLASEQSLEILNGSESDAPPPRLAPAEATPTIPASQRHEKPIGGLGIAGIVITPIGFTSFGIGLQRMVRGDVRIEGRQGDRVDHYRSPATDAAFGIGLAVAAVGATFILIDQFVCKQRSHGCRRVAASSDRTSFVLRF